MESMPPGVPFQIENYTDTYGKEIVSGTFSSHMVGNLYMENPKDFSSGSLPLSPVEFYCQDGVTCLYANAGSGLTHLSGKFDLDLSKRFIQDVFNGNSPRNPIPGWNDILNKGTFGVNFTTPEGKFIYYPSPPHAYKVFNISYDSEKDDPSFIQYKGRVNWLLKCTVDRDGNFIYIVASDKPDPSNFSNMFFGVGREWLTIRINLQRN
jgi:hypothetical protein